MRMVVFIVFSSNVTDLIIVEPNHLKRSDELSIVNCLIFVMKARTSCRSPGNRREESPDNAEHHTS